MYLYSTVRFFLEVYIFNTARMHSIIYIFLREMFSQKAAQLFSTLIIIRFFFKEFFLSSKATSPKNVTLKSRVIAADNLFFSPGIKYILLVTFLL